MKRKTGNSTVNQYFSENNSFPQTGRRTRKTVHAKSYPLDSKFQLHADPLKCGTRRQTLLLSLHTFIPPHSGFSVKEPWFILWRQSDSSSWPHILTCKLIGGLQRKPANSVIFFLSWPDHNRKTILDGCRQEMVNKFSIFPFPESNKHPQPRGRSPCQHKAF